MQLFLVLFLPLLGTTLGSACVFFLKKEASPFVERLLVGFAAGIMMAASIWSLLIPALEQSEGLGTWAFLPAVAGFWVGILFLWALDHLIPHLHRDTDTPEGPPTTLSQSSMLLLAVALHNIPEGMAVGAVAAGWLTGNGTLSLAAAFSLSLGIAIQNFPEGAIISMPLHTKGASKAKSFWLGTLSGVAEPAAAILTMLAAGFFIPVIPAVLGFAAGAMIYVIVEELIPEMSTGPHSNIATIAFSFGFTLMLILDTALG